VASYELLYWSVPFRGQFVRAILAHAGVEWAEWDEPAIAELMDADVADMPVPFMGPPVLIDAESGFAVSQMPAILFYVGEKLDLLPKTPELRALTMKVVNDANDVIDELTLNGGQAMWSEERWQDFIPRLRKWMTFWEVLGTKHGLTADDGYLLGGSAPGIADIVTATLWTTIAERFDRIEKMLAETAPRTLALSRRVSSHPALTKLDQQTRRAYGDDYAGGQIGASMASVLTSRAG
jgi:glutathione S-transferase